MTLVDLLKRVYEQGFTGGEDDNFERYKRMLIHYGVSEKTVYYILQLGYSNSESISYGNYIQEPDFINYIPEQFRYITVI